MLTRYKRNLNSFMDDMLNWHGDLMNSFDGWFAPSRLSLGFNSVVEMKEDEKNLYYYLDVPGISKENLSITQEGNTIRVEGKREDRTQHQNISAQFTISTLAVPDTLNAQLENGVLTLSFERKEIQPKVELKRIEVKEIKSIKGKNKE